MRKVIAALMLVAAFASCSLSYDGDGSKDSPYVIYSHNDFSALRSELNSGNEKYYVLSCDLQLSKWSELIAPVYTFVDSTTTSVWSYDDDKEEWYWEVISVSQDIVDMGSPITGDGELHAFSGHFDGRGHTVYIKLIPVPDESSYTYYPNANTRIEHSFTYYLNSSLFGAIEADDSSEYAVKDLTVGGRINGGFLGAGITSTLRSGKIINCHVSCDIKISNITGDEELELHRMHTGGIAANMYGGEVKSCDFSGNITTSGGSFFSYAGGIVGAMAAGKIEGCKVRHYSIIKAEGDSDSERAQSAGGIVGFLEVDDLYANDSQDVTVTYCEFEGGEITGSNTAGGIVGTTYGGLIAYNLVGEDSRISGGTVSGGIVGHANAGSAVYSNRVMGGYVQTDSRASGGIVGLLELGEVRDNYSRASVRGDAVSKGGVIGEIHNHYGNTDNVTGNSYMGSGYAIGLDEHMNVNIDGENTRLDPVLYFEGSATLTQATENVQYREAITVSLPAVVDLTPIPSWLNPVQNGSTITLSGIPTETGTSRFTLTASYGYQTLSRTFSITVTPVLMISADSYVTAKIGDYVEIPLSVYANDYDISNASFTWSVEGGTLPSGLSLDETGSISGYVASSGTYDITVQVTPENISLSPVTYSITIDVETEITLSFDTELPDAAVSKDYSHKFQASGVSNNLITWSADLGAIPEGLTFYTSGLLAGKPTKSGSYSFLVSAFSGDITVSGYAKIDVLPFFNIAILTDRLPDAKVNTRYSQVLSYDAPSGYSAKWEKVSGDLPSGFTLSEGGTISGVTSRTGSYSFRLKLTAGLTVSRDFTLRVLSNDTSPDKPVKESVVIVSESLPDGVIGEEYRAELVAVPEASSWSNSGGITPPGLTLSADGVISGVPSVAGDFYFYATASHESYNSSTREYSIHIASSKAGGETSGSSGGGGGGCNSGGMMLLAGMLMLLRRKK